MKDETVLFARLTHTDGHNATIRIIIFFTKQRNYETRQIVEYTRSVLCALLYVLTATYVHGRVTLMSNSQTCSNLACAFVTVCYTAG
jgi:hypothetical protein